MNENASAPAGHTFNDVLIGNADYADNMALAFAQGQT